MNTTNIEKHLLWYDLTSLTLTFLSPIIGAISSISCLIILNTYLKMLHKTFKTLLNIIFTHNIIIFLTSISIITYMYVNQSQTFLLCVAKVVTNSLPTYLTMFGVALMSFLRYHIAWKIKNQESTKNTIWYMITLIILYGLFDYFNYGPFSIVGVIFFESPIVAAKCTGRTTQGFPFFPIFHMVKGLTIIFVGIFYDWKMIAFLRKNNAHSEPGQAKLVPWKSGEKQYDFMVPVTATIASVITGLVGVSACMVVISGLVQDKSESWKYAAVVINSLCSIQMPVMIFMTIRAAKHKKPGPTIPKGPMFHETDTTKNEENIEMLENDQVINDDERSMSSNQSVSPLPKIIHVKPIIHNAECHM